MDCIYKDILNNIEKAEKLTKRLEMDGFLINKKEIRDIAIVAKQINNSKSFKYFKVISRLSEFLRRLGKLEKIDEYYKWMKFRLNTDGDLKLFIDAYVNDTLNILKVVDDEIKEYGFDNLGKFTTKFYDLIYSLIKLEVMLYGESTIYKELFNHIGHFHFLSELMLGDINRMVENVSDRKQMSDELKNRQYDQINHVLIELVKCDVKVKKMLKLSNNNELEIKKLYKKKK